MTLTVACDFGLVDEELGFGWKASDVTTGASVDVSDVVSGSGASECGASECGASEYGASECGASEYGASECGASEYGASEDGDEVSVEEDVDSVYGQ